MTKAALFSLGLAALLAAPAAVPAQDSTAIAVNEAVLRQHNTIVLRKKLAEARATHQRGEIVVAAKLYQECVEEAHGIGSGIDAETAQAVAGLSATRLVLARDAQSRGDLHEAQTQIQQVLKADPKNANALAFKRQNDQLIEMWKGRMPDAATLELRPQAAAQKTQASTLVQDGKLLYEMGKLEEAEAKLSEASKIDPDNSGAYYYLNLIQQAKFARESVQHTVDTQTRMTQVEKQWVLPTAHVQLPVPNPYAANKAINTGPGRQAIIAKLDRIRLEDFSTGDGMPLSEVLRTLSEKCRSRDPEQKGINFLINPNEDKSGLSVAAPVTQGIGGMGGGFGGAGGGYGAPGFPAPAAMDPATGMPVAPAAGTGTGGSEALDVAAVSVKIPSLKDVRLADVLEAIVLVADHPIKYSIQDFAIVFSVKGPETVQMFTRTFRVDPNTFYSGLESVGSASFGSVNSSSTGGGGGMGGNSGGGGGNQNNSGAVVGVVNAFSGAGGFRNTGNGQGGGGGGGGGQGQGAINPLAAGGGAGGGGNVGGNGGLNYITQVTLATTVSEAARAYFTALGVNLASPPGKAVFFNDRLGKLVVKATEQDLDTIERAIEALNEVPPQVHIKARFIEVEQDDNKALGFDWHLGQFNMGGDAVGTGGSSPSLNVPTSAANPLGAFPGNTAASLVAPSAGDQLLTGGLRQSAPTLATITGIMTDPNFRVALRALEQRSGVENLGEPEVTTTSGRQTQMRATSVLTVVVGINFQQGTSATTTTGTGAAGTGQ